MKLIKTGRFDKPSDAVYRLGDHWYFMIDGRGYGPWPDRDIASTKMQEEKTRLGNLFNNVVYL